MYSISKCGLQFQITNLNGKIEKKPYFDHILNAYGIAALHYNRSILRDSQRMKKGPNLLFYRR
jgi:hypothetical protein